MRILMLLSNSIGYDSRVLHEATALCDEGHSVELIDFGEEKEGTSINGLSIHTIPWPKSGILSHKWTVRHFYFHKKAIQKALSLEFDTIHCHDLDTIPIGIYLKKKRNAKLVYDAHEIFPWLLNRGIARFIKPYFSFWEKRAVTFTDRLIIAEDQYTDYFQKLGHENFTIVLNCKEIISETYVPPQNDVLTIGYFGTLSKQRFLIELIDVVNGLDKIKLVIAGSGPLTNIISERACINPNIHFWGRIPSDQVIPETLKLDAVICMINPADDNNRIASANKQFEAMVTGRPIITTKGTRSGEITENQKCGLVIDYSISALKDAIATLANSPSLCEELGRNALKTALEKYNWSNQKEKLIQLYASLRGRI